jgi:uncharacterized protein YybS (DUF2232 family)
MFSKYRTVTLLVIAGCLIYAVGLLFPLNTAQPTGADTKNLLAFLKIMGLPPKQAVQTVKLSEEIWPSFLLIFSSLLAYGSYLAGFKVLGGLGAKLREPAPFSTWRWNEWLVWGFVIALALQLLKPQLAGMGQEWVSPLALNLLVMFSFLYLIQGLSVVSFLLTQAKLWALARIMVYLLLMMQWPLLVVFGLLDIWVDFRKKLAKLP